MVTGSSPSNARRLSLNVRPVSPGLRLHTMVTQTGDQRHSRTRSRRRISIDPTSSSKTYEDFIIRKTIQVTAVGFVILTAVLFFAVMFDGALASGAAPRSDDHHPAGNSKKFILGMPISKDKMYLRGSLKGFNKRANNDEGGESGEGITVKAPLRSLRETRDPYIDIIERAADAASKAIRDAAEAELAATVAAVEDEVAVSGGVNRRGDSWDAYAVME